MSALLACGEENYGHTYVRGGIKKELMDKRRGPWERSSVWSAIGVTLVLLGCTACEGDIPEFPVDGGATVSTVEQFYSDEEVWSVNLRLSRDAVERLKQTPKEYVQGDVQIGNSIFKDVGIRLKGSFSFQNLDGKSSFKVKFNRYHPDQRFVGLEKVTFNNMRQDRSMVHERLAYNVFRAAGVPAPRSGYVRVSLNGQLYGLYANIETMDDRFLKANYEDGKGNLYEAPWGADLEEDAIDKYEQDEGDDTSRRDLEELLEWVSRPGDDIFFDENTPLNTDEFLRFVAVEAIIGHWDGYWKANNYFIYNESSRPEWTFLPWGLDGTFDRDLQPFSSGGVLAEKCFASIPCMAEYGRIGLEVLQTYEDLDLRSLVNRIKTLIRPHAEVDPRAPHPPEKMERFMEIVRARIQSTPDRVRKIFSCIENGQELDVDGDGYGACKSDCDDSTNTAYPGATEICDGIDNNCNGSVDEGGCPCQEKTIEGKTYLFCEAQVSWNAARVECESKTARLAVFTTESASAMAFETASSLAPALYWHIGADDRGDEGVWLDTTEERLPLLNFAPGEPDDFGGEDCAALAPFGFGEWADIRCNTVSSYICERL